MGGLQEGAGAQGDLQGQLPGAHRGTLGLGELGGRGHPQGDGVPGDDHRRGGGMDGCTKIGLMWYPNSL